MSATVTKVPTAARVEAIELRNGDLALAVLELANVVERLVVGDKKRWKGEESKAMLAAVDNARALATPEDNDDDPEPEPASSALAAWLTPEKQASIDAMHAAADTTSRYFVSFLYGDGMATDDLEHVHAEFRSGGVVSVTDRHAGVLLAHRGIWQDTATAPCDAAEAA